MDKRWSSVANLLVLRTANGSSVDSAECVEFEARKPPTDFCRSVLEQRWLDHTIDHRRGKSVASVFGRHKDEGVLKLKALLERFGLARYETDYGGLTHVIGMGMGPSRATAIPRTLNGNT
jgi:hypothetical protein